MMEIHVVEDALAALLGYLGASPAVETQVGTKVYGEQIPDEEIQLLGGKARKCVLVKRAGLGTGGDSQASYLPVEDFRVDVWNYGATYVEAAQVRYATYPALKYMSRALIGGVLLHTAIRVGGPVSLVDPDIRWPLILETWQVKAGELLAA